MANQRRQTSFLIVERVRPGQTTQINPHTLHFNNFLRTCERHSIKLNKTTKRKSTETDDCKNIVFFVLISTRWFTANSKGQCYITFFFFVLCGYLTVRTIDTIYPLSQHCWMYSEGYVIWDESDFSLQRTTQHIIQKDTSSSHTMPHLFLTTHLLYCWLLAPLASTQTQTYYDNYLDIWCQYSAGQNKHKHALACKWAHKS